MITATEPRVDAVRQTERIREALAPVLEGLQLDVEIGLLGWQDELTRPHAPAPDADVLRPTVGLHFYGNLAILGPVRDAASSRPCGRCLARRWQALRTRELRDALELGGRTTAVSGTPHLTGFAVDTVGALLQLLRDTALGTETAGASAMVTVLDLQTFLTKSYPLATDPECPGCAPAPPDDVLAGRRDAAPAPGAGLTLEAVPKTAPGSFRTRTLDDLDLDEIALANPVCGVLGPRVIREYDSPTTASAYGRMGMRVGSYLQETFWGGHTFSYGDSARIGLIEGLERYAGMRSPGPGAEVVTSLARLRARGIPALDPRECGLYADEFYRSDPHRVAPFTDDREIPWVWAHSLVHDQPVLVPSLLTYYHSVPRADRFVQESSNGCASGTSLTEAVHHGLMELIERDAFLLTWYAQLRLPELDGRTSTQPTTRALIDRLALHGYRARFFDARITFPVPVVVAVAERVDGGRGTLCFGAGASPDPEQALRSALIEIATDAPQSARRTTWNLDRLTAMSRDFTKVTKLHDHPLVYGLPEMRRYADFLLAPGNDDRRPLPLAEAYADRVPPRAMDVRTDVMTSVGMLADAGFDVLAVDQTFPLERELGFRTASVLVPGLVPIDFGWSRQRALHHPRVRRAPREAGLRSRDLRPEDLNRAPHPFP